MISLYGKTTKKVDKVVKVLYTDCMKKIRYDFGKGYIEQFDHMQWTLVKKIKKKNGEEGVKPLGYYPTLISAKLDAVDVFGRLVETNEELIKVINEIKIVKEYIKND